MKGLIWEAYACLASSNGMSLEEETQISECMKLPTVKQVLKTKPEKILNTDIEDEITVLSAIHEMKKNQTSYVVVRDTTLNADLEVECDEASDSTHSELVGILTERDIVKRVFLQGKEASKTLVKDVMSHSSWKGIHGKEENERDYAVCSVLSKTSLLTCMRLMTGFDIRHLPVTNKQKTRVLGLITSSDVVEAICSHYSAA